MDVAAHLPVLRVHANRVRRAEGCAMNTTSNNFIILGEDPDQIIEPVGYDFGLSRRTFVQCLGAGLLITVIAPAAIGQERQRTGGGAGGRRRGEPVPIEARLHIAPDGAITVMTGKVECGQGSRAQITQAAAEELRVPVHRVQLLMADTATCPDDGITAGSRTTPSTLPSVRQACAAARDLLLATAAEKFGTSADAIEIKDGV